MHRHSLRLTLGLALVLVAGLVMVPGCGGKKEEPAPKAESPAAPPSTAPAPAPAEPGAAPQSGAAPATRPAGDFVSPDPTAIAARVNGQPITERQVWGLAAAQLMQLRSRGERVPVEAEPQVRRTALQFLIDSELMAQAARQSGIQVDAKDVDARIASWKGQFKSPEEYQKALAAQKLSEADLRHDVEGQFYAQAYANSLTANVKPDEAQAKTIYEQNKERFKKSDEAHVLQILVNSKGSDPAPKREEAKKRAEEAHAKVAGGADFGQIAKQYSQAPNAAKGGDVGYFPRGVMVPKFEELAFTLPVGTISPVFETPYGYNVIKVLDRRAGTIATWDEVKPQLLRMVADEMRNRMVEAKVAALRPAAKIEIVGAEYKTPPPSAPATGGAAPAQGAR